MLYLLLGLFLTVIARVAVRADAGALGLGNVTADAVLRPAGWTCLVLLSVGALIEALSRYVAPAVVAVPSAGPVAWLGASTRPFPRTAPAGGTRQGRAAREAPRPRRTRRAPGHHHRAAAGAPARDGRAVLVLPHDLPTERALDRERLDALPQRAFVVNVGRRSTVDEDALVESPGTGTIAGAAIDVTAQDPPSAESPLWSAPHLIITPHMAGGRPVGAADLLRENLWVLAQGSEFTNPVARARA